MKEKNNQPVRLVEPALLIVRDLEQLLQIDKRSVARLTKKGILPLPLKLGGGNRWKAADITAAIDRLESRPGELRHYFRSRKERTKPQVLAAGC